MDEDPIRPLKRGRLSDDAYDILRDRLVRGQYPPGSRVVETEIARSLQVSQAPVRDALARLASDGLVVQHPHRGTFVAEVSVEDARDAYAVRVPLERVAAQQFLDRADPGRLDAMQDALDRMRTAAADDDVAALVAADVDFHRTMWDATGNDALSRTWGLLERTMRDLTNVSNRLYFSDLGAVAETHVPLIDALRGRDPRAPDLFAQHAHSVWESIGE